MRKPRYYYESNFYHVMVQGDEKKFIFQSYRNKEKYLYYLKHNAFRNDVKAHICDEPVKYHFSSYRDFSNLDSRIKEISDLSYIEIKSILENPDTITMFLDDEYSKEDINIAFERIKKEISYNESDDNSIGQMYLKLKEHCRINNIEIAKLLNMKRTTMIGKLKKLGLKGGIM